MAAMLLSWAIGFGAKFSIPPHILSPSLIESLSGFAVPVVILGIMELWCAVKGIRNERWEAMESYTDPAAEEEPGAEMKEATRKFSYLAVNCFCITLGAIVLLLAGLLLAGDPKTVAVKGIVLGFMGAVSAFIAGYIVYRLIKRK